MAEIAAAVVVVVVVGIEAFVAVRVWHTRDLFAPIVFIHSIDDNDGDEFGGLLEYFVPPLCLLAACIYYPIACEIIWTFF